jgi:hypothetical protein
MTFGAGYRPWRRGATGYRGWDSGTRTGFGGEDACGMMNDEWKSKIYHHARRVVGDADHGAPWAIS